MVIPQNPMAYNLIVPSQLQYWRITHIQYHCLNHVKSALCLSNSIFRRSLSIEVYSISSKLIVDLNPTTKYTYCCLLEYPYIVLAFAG